jgi:hypothetical protein
VFFSDFAQLGSFIDFEMEVSSQEKYLASVFFQYVVHMGRNGVFYTELAHGKKRIKLSVGIP